MISDYKRKSSDKDQLANENNDLKNSLYQLKLDKEQLLNQKMELKKLYEDIN